MEKGLLDQMPVTIDGGRSSSLDPLAFQSDEILERTKPCVNLSDESVRGRPKHDSFHDVGCALLSIPIFRSVDG